jgi:hypothetical protein
VDRQFVCSLRSAVTKRPILWWIHGAVALGFVMAYFLGFFEARPLIASHDGTGPSPGQSDVILVKTSNSGCSDTLTPGDTFNPVPDACSIIAYTITVTKLDGPDLQQLTISDCIADQPVDYGGASPNISFFLPHNCSPVAGGPNPAGVMWNFNPGSNETYLQDLNKKNGGDGTITLGFFVSARKKDACFQNTAFGEGRTAEKDIMVVPSHITRCIANPSYPYLTTTKGAVHAGGGIGTSLCGAGGNIVGRTDGAGGGSRGEYIVSAGANISGFYSGPAPSTTYDLTLGNSPGLGRYGLICRSNLIEAANKYTGAKAPYLGSLSAPTDTMITAGGTTALNTQTVSNRVTLYVNGDLYINGNILLSGGSFTRSNLPTLGVIASGSIYIAPGVTRLDGYYYAAGSINTCLGPKIENGEASGCSAHLTVNGLLTANSFKFRRTGPFGAVGLQEAERINFNGALLVSPPPAFKDLVSTSATRPVYEGERPPLR